MAMTHMRLLSPDFMSHVRLSSDEVGEMTSIGTDTDQKFKSSGFIQNYLPRTTRTLAVSRRIRRFIDHADL